MLVFSFTFDETSKQIQNNNKKLNKLKKKLNWSNFGVNCAIVVQKTGNQYSPCCHFVGNENT